MDKRCKKCRRSLPAEHFHASSRNPDGLRRTCKECRSAIRKGEPIPSPESEPAAKVGRASRYLVTYAQNATPVHSGFLRAMRQYAEHRNAQIVVIAGRYKNPTSIFSRHMSDDDWWDPPLADYIFGGSVQAAPKLYVHGNVSVQPTAVRPLSGMDMYAAMGSCVFGHPKQELRLVATAKRRWPRILVTTGACTKPNYTASKAGRKAECAHQLGAVVIERDSKAYHIRTVQAQPDGSFHDLDCKYAPDGVTEGVRSAAIIWGDAHCASMDHQVKEATATGPGSICSVCRPEVAVYHDVLSMVSRPKYRGGAYQDLASTESWTVEDELHQCMETLAEITPDDCAAYVVSSNHDDHLTHWLETADFRRDLKNAPVFLALWEMMLKHAEEHGTQRSPLALWAEANYEYPPHFLSRDEPLTICGHELSFHGHQGLNGTRGTISQYGRLATPNVVGHSHSPGIQDRCMQVGVSGALDQGYNHLPSTWMHSHGLIYPDGGRTLLNIIDGRWCT